MKALKYLFSIFAAACTLGAQTAKSPELALGDIVKFGDKSYMVVFNFDNYPKYEEFQRNTLIMKNTNAAILGLMDKIGKESDPVAKANLERQLKQFQDEFDINDKTMQRGYNFSSKRNYMLMFLKTNICIPISKEEFSQYQFKSGEKINPLDIVSKDGAHYMRKISIDGFNENAQFQKVLRDSLTYRSELAQLRKRLDNNSNLKEVSEISEKIAELEKALKQSEQELFTKYGLKGGASYLIEIEKSKLLMLLTPEDMAKMEAQKKIQKQSEK